MRNVATLITILIIGLYSCQEVDKDIYPNKGANKQLGNSLRSFPELSKYENMLHFQDEESFFNAMDELSELSNEYEFEPQIDTDEEEDVSDEEPESPVLDQFENQLDFISVRKLEEIREDSFLEDGGHPSEYDDHFIWDDFLATLLNSDLEVRVGDQIFKFINEFYTVRFPYERSDILQELRSNNLNVLSDQTIILEEFNELEEDMYISAGYSYQVDESQIFLQNQSLSQSTIEQVVWNFGEQYGKLYGESPELTISEEDVNDGLEFTLTVINNKGGIDRVTGAIAGKAEGAEASNCDPDFTYNGNLNNLTTNPWNVYFYNQSYLYTLAGTPPSNYYWTFGDGTNSTLPNPIHTYTSYGTGQYQVCLTEANSTLGCSERICKVIKLNNYNEECCKKKDKKKIKEYFGPENGTNKRYYKAKVKINSGAYVKRIVFKVKHYKKKNNNKWKKSKADYILVEFKGDLFEPEANNSSNCTSIAIPLDEPFKKYNAKKFKKSQSLPNLGLLKKEALRVYIKVDDGSGRVAEREFFMHSKNCD